MAKIQVVYQSYGARYAGLATSHIAKAMWAEWKRQCKTNGTDRFSRHVDVDFASDTDDKDDVSSHHGLLLQAPFDSPILITGGYGGYDFGSVELVDTEDELGYGTDWQDDYPDMTRNEAILCKAIGSIMWDEWKDENGLLWCEVKGCIETYLEALPEEALEVINNT